MASVLLSPYGVGQQFFDDNGVPLAGGLIYTYQAGSSTPLVTYTTSSGTVANANPIVLDASGRTPQQIWLLTGYSYKFILQNANAVLIQTLDNIYPILQNAPASVPAVPAGCILLWSGSTGSIPATFLLCDGTNGTPDLRDRFLVGAGNTYAVNATGGSADSVVITHNHTATSTVTDAGHDHDAITQTSGSSSSGAQFANSFSGSVNTTSTQMIQTATTGITVATTTANAGVSGTNANLPPYYALAYIMKQ